MFKRLHLTAGVALTLLVVSPSIGRAQVITVEYYNARLSEVVRNFAAYSGRTIVLASDAGDPEVTASIRDVDWPRGLDQILGTQSLVARVDPSGVIHVERPRRLVSVAFYDAALSAVVQSFAAYAGRTIVLPPDAGDLKVTASFQDIDWRRALDGILDAHALVARDDASDVIRIERRNPPPIKTPDPPSDSR